MDTFEIYVQFYRQIEKFIEELQSGTEHKENIFLFGTCYFQKEQFYTEKGDINIATMVELETYISRANEYSLKYDLEDYIAFFKTCSDLTVSIALENDNSIFKYFVVQSMKRLLMKLHPKQLATDGKHNLLRLNNIQELLTQLQSIAGKTYTKNMFLLSVNYNLYKYIVHSLFSRIFLSRCVELTKKISFFNRGSLIDCRCLQAKTRCLQTLATRKHKCGCFHQNAKRITIRHKTTSQR